MMAKILVGGGASFIGSHVVDLLISQDCEEEIVNYHRTVETAV
jgi:nucleoside-diphosphate-sugar epimerase